MRWLGLVSLDTSLMENVSRAKSMVSAQLVDHDGRRAAADVDAVEVVAEILQHEHFLAHVGEVRSRAIFREGEAVERAVRAKPLAKRHVHVEHVALPGVGGGMRSSGGRLEFQVVLRALAHDRREHTFRQHGYLNMITPRENARATSKAPRRVDVERAAANGLLHDLRKLTT